MKNLFVFECHFHTQTKAAHSFSFYRLHRDEPAKTRGGARTHTDIQAQAPLPLCLWDFHVLLPPHWLRNRMSVSGKKEFDVKQILRLRWRWFSHSSLYCYVFQRPLQDYGERDGGRPGHRHHGAHLQKRLREGGGGGMESVLPWNVL